MLAIPRVVQDLGVIYIYTGTGVGVLIPITVVTYIISIIDSCIIESKFTI